MFIDGQSYGRYDGLLRLVFQAKDPDAAGLKLIPSEIVTGRKLRALPDVAPLDVRNREIEN
jgi:hypothetical protein